MKTYRKMSVALFAFLLLVLLVACSSGNVVDETNTSGNITVLEQESTDTSESVLSQEESWDKNMITLTVNGHTLTGELADNSSAQAFKELLANGPLTISMSDYGSMEKVGSLGTTLPTNNEQITAQPGDIILFMGSSLVVYYNQNSWNFTRMGRINDVTQGELKEILGNGNVSITFELVK